MDVTWFRDFPSRPHESVPPLLLRLFFSPYFSFFKNQISCLFLASQMLSGEEFLFLVWCGLIQQGVASFLPPVLVDAEHFCINSKQGSACQLKCVFGDVWKPLRLKTSHIATHPPSARLHYCLKQHKSKWLPPCYVAVLSMLYFEIISANLMNPFEHLFWYY